MVPDHGSWHAQDMEGGGALRVVLVDDEDSVRALIGITLGLQPGVPFRVVGEAVDGEGAVTAVAASSPDCVVLDLLMPGRGGMAAIPEIRAADPQCKIVVFSALSATQMEAEALALGADAYIEKTKVMSDLPDMLERICAAPRVP